jgi:hypothetical protein
VGKLDLHALALQDTAQAIDEYGIVFDEQDLHG